MAKSNGWNTGVNTMLSNIDSSLELSFNQHQHFIAHWTHLITLYLSLSEPVHVYHSITISSYPSISPSVHICFIWSIYHNLSTSISPSLSVHLDLFISISPSWPLHIYLSFLPSSYLSLLHNLFISISPPQPVYIYLYLFISIYQFFNIYHYYTIYL